MRCIRLIGPIMILALGASRALWPQTSSALLEKGIYTEETLGNLPEAIKIYQQVVADVEAGRPNAALALFRLGMCFQKSGNREEARASFAKLAKLYPEQKDLIAKIPKPSENAPQFAAPPWVDGEVMQLAVKTIGGSEIGLQVYRADSVQEAGKNAWRLQSAILTMSMAMGSSVVTDAQSLVPIRKTPTYNAPDRIRQALYFPDHLELSVLGSNGVTTRQLSLDRAVYDEEQLVQLLRCLPLAVGYKVILPILDGSRISEVNIEVTGRETVAAPAGTFDAFRLIVRRAGGDRETNYWISADGHRYLLREERDGASSQELRAVTIEKKGHPAWFEDKQAGFTLSAPVGWSLYSPGTPSLGKVIKALDPDLAADCTLVVQDVPKDQIDTTSPNKFIDAMSEMWGKIYKKYTIRPESRDTVTLSGVTAARYIVDLKHLVTGEDMVEYNIMLLASGRAYLFKFQAVRDDFDRFRPDFDFIASSLKVQ